MVFGLVPPHASIHSIFSLFSVLAARSWIWSLKRRELSISTPRNFALDTGLTTSLKSNTHRFSSSFLRFRLMMIRLDLSPFSFTLHLRHQPSISSTALCNFWTANNSFLPLAWTAVSSATWYWLVPLWSPVGKSLTEMMYMSGDRQLPWGVPTHIHHFS